MRSGSAEAMAENKDQPKASKLAPPPAVVEAVRLASRAARPAAWAAAIAAHMRRDGPVAFSAGLVRRFDIADAPGTRAADFAQRLVPGELPIDEVELTVSPYAPPMRQLSRVRQGVPMWSSSDSQRAQRVGASPTPTGRPAPVRGAPEAQPAAPARGAPPATRKREEKGKIPEDLIAILNMHRALGHIK